MKTEKNSSSGSNQVVTSDQSLQQPNNRKQAPKEKAKTANSNKEKYLHLGRQYDNAFERLGHFCKTEAASQHLCTTFTGA